MCLPLFAYSYRNHIVLGIELQPALIPWSLTQNMRFGSFWHFVHSDTLVASGQKAEILEAILERSGMFDTGTMARCEWHCHGRVDVCIP